MSDPTNALTYEQYGTALNAQPLSNAGRIAELEAENAELKRELKNLKGGYNYDDGYADGYKEGYKDGYSDGVTDNETSEEGE